MNDQSTPATANGPKGSPLAKGFATRSNYYVYDAGTNEFYQTESDLSDILEAAESVGLEKLASERTSSCSTMQRQKLQEISQAQAQGILSWLRPAEMTYGIDRHELRSQLHNELGALILNVTDSCNLRCSYCTYSGNYSLSRRHASRHMSWTDAKRAIDFYMTRCKTARIGFFGGEPLIRFELISKCIEYANSLAPSPVEINISTNGVFLTERMIKLFAQHDVKLAVSIDGPREVHDRFRITAAGKPSFNKVLGSIRLAAEVEPEWYRRSVYFLMVVNPPYNLALYESFISAERELFQDSRAITLSFVNTDDTNMFGDLSVYERGKRNEIQRLRKQYRDAHIQGDLSSLTIECSLFDKVMYRFHARRLPTTPRAPVGPNGSCVPGVRRLFVDTNGIYHLCERINPTLSIGSLQDGLDIDAIRSIMEDFVALTKPECLECWASRFCPICPAHVGGDYYVDRSKKLLLCESIKYNLTQDFILYNEILEENPRAFDYLDEWVMV